jgi:hypothetical protein
VAKKENDQADRCTSLLLRITTPFGLSLFRPAGMCHQRPTLMGVGAEGATCNSIQMNDADENKDIEDMHKVVGDILEMAVRRRQSDRREVKGER